MIRYRSYKRRPNGGVNKRDNWKEISNIVYKIDAAMVFIIGSISKYTILLVSKNK